MVFVLWAIHIFQIATQISLAWLGVYPRDWDGAIGIFTAPLIHGDLAHLMSNSVPFLVTATMLFFFYRKIAWQSFAVIYILTGALVWLFGRQVFHIGASGVVYGLVAFIFWSGIFRRDLKSIILALIVTILYSGMVAGVLPNQEGISWESHLLGAFAGIFTAYVFRKGVKSADDEDDHIDNRKLFYNKDDFKVDDSEKDYFLDRDTFDKRY